MTAMLDYHKITMPMVFCLILGCSRDQQALTDEEKPPVVKLPEVDRAKVMKEAIAVKIQELYDDYEANQVAADLKYQGKWLVVEGTVEGISQGGKVALKLGHLPEKFKLFYGWTVFHETMTTRLAKLEKGQKITVYGHCEKVEPFWFAIILRDCFLPNP